MQGVTWDKVILDRFIELSCLTETEEQILSTVARGRSVTRQSVEFNISPATVNRVRKRIAEKYDAARWYDTKV